MKKTLRLLTGISIFLFFIGYPLQADQVEAGHQDKEQTRGHGNEKSDTKGSHWASPKVALKTNNPVPVTDESIESGKKLFQRNCSVCHGKSADGNGVAAASMNPKPSNLAAMAGTHPDGDFAWKIKNGRGLMPAWKSILTEKQVWEVTNFIQSLSNESRSNQDDDHSNGTSSPEVDNGHAKEEAPQNAIGEHHDGKS